MSPKRSSKPPFFPASMRSAASLLSSSNVAAPPLGRLRPPTPNWALIVAGANPTNATINDTAVALNGRVIIVSAYVEPRVDVLVSYPVG
mmetsp:Transcript_26752/g.55717  ORF Transcript_26752/g.55717 Transcript_26752/m.55717 type:complete len:89 (-) Transcript_26752:50-316(-)